jgi:hypothetical protein
MSSEIKKGVACAIQALDGTRARRSLVSRLTDLTHGAYRKNGYRNSPSFCPRRTTPSQAVGDSQEF